MVPKTALGLIVRPGRILELLRFVTLDLLYGIANVFSRRAIPAEQERPSVMRANLYVDIVRSKVCLVTIKRLPLPSKLSLSFRS